MDEQDEVLVCGCGNSEMSVDMFDDGEDCPNIGRFCFFCCLIIFSLNEYSEDFEALFGLHSTDGCGCAVAFAVISHHVHDTGIVKISPRCHSQQMREKCPNFVLVCFRQKLALDPSCPPSLGPSSLNEGFENIVNADMSRVAIYQMAENYKAYPMECKL